jgi:DNA-binding transcriptional LysR family regulator
LVREGFDCVLRVGVLVDSSYVAHPLGHYRMINCASASYVSRFGLPRQLDELAHHHLIHYVSTLGSRDSGFEYVDPDKGNSVKYVAMSGALTVNNSDAYLVACLAGLGVIQVPEPSVRALLDSGQLAEVMPEFRAASMPVSLIYANRRHRPRRVQVFMTWLEAIMRDRLMA